MNDSSFLHANVKATINRKAKNVWFVLGFLFKLFPTTWTLHYKFQLPSPWNEYVRRADRHSRTTSFDPATERSPKQSPSSLAAAQTFIPSISPSPQQFRGKKEKEIAPSPNQPSLKQYSLPLKKKKKKLQWQNLWVGSYCPAAPPFPQYYAHPRRRKRGWHKYRLKHPHSLELPLSQV